MCLNYVLWRFSYVGIPPKNLRDEKTQLSPVCRLKVDTLSIELWGAHAPVGCMRHLLRLYLQWQLWPVILTTPIN